MRTLGFASRPRDRFALSRIWRQQAMRTYARLAGAIVRKDSCTLVPAGSAPEPMSYSRRLHNKPMPVSRRVKLKTLVNVVNSGYLCRHPSARSSLSECPKESAEPGPGQAACEEMSCRFSFREQISLNLFDRVARGGTGGPRWHVPEPEAKGVVFTGPRPSLRSERATHSDGGCLWARGEGRGGS